MSVFQSTFTQRILKKRLNYLISKLFQLFKAKFLIEMVTTIKAIGSR